MLERNEEQRCKDDLELGSDGKIKCDGQFIPRQPVSIQEQQPPTNAEPWIQLTPQNKSIHRE